MDETKKVFFFFFNDKGKHCLGTLNIVLVITGGEKCIQMKH